MQRTNRRPVDLPAVFRGRDAVSEGVLSPAQLRGALVKRVVQGVYRPAWVPLTHELKCQGVALTLPAGVAVTGRSQATLLGVSLAAATDDVEACAPEGLAVPQRKGVVVRQQRGELEPGRDVAGVPLTSDNRMGFNLAARWPLPQAVAHLDAVCRAGLIDPTGFREWLADRHENDVVHVRAAAQLIDPRAESLPESRTRVILHVAGLDVVPQYEIRYNGAFVARADLAIIEAKVAIEYDGAWHALREQLRGDRERLNRLTRAGWLVVHITADMLHEPHRIVAAVRAAIAQQAARYPHLLGKTL
jgi:hypothetical protein